MFVSFYILHCGYWNPFRKGKPQISCCPKKQQKEENDKKVYSLSQTHNYTFKHTYLYTHTYSRNTNINHKHIFKMCVTGIQNEENNNDDYNDDDNDVQCRTTNNRFTVFSTLHTFIQTHISFAFTPFKQEFTLSF